jgi:hypothetical protein
MMLRCRCLLVWIGLIFLINNNPGGAITMTSAAADTTTATSIRTTHASLASSNAYEIASATQMAQGHLICDTFNIEGQGYSICYIANNGTMICGPGMKTLPTTIHFISISCGSGACGLDSEVSCCVHNYHSSHSSIIIPSLDERPYVDVVLGSYSLFGSDR